ncbi:hypothetical protein JI435_113590 [Parastagonospora nodorum SN15]|uniref:Uncharacterized protein n=1 Tax=Phaeosphaeria nodorum (strain SN15 / ATCC MYA-4574 / FGSC 10173) TaxID=321614 RepID=A0A7U2FC96_PHANO|nr:hypothetical protein JI435_113590 [Parastagonospora nodorum SN15]
MKPLIAASTAAALAALGIYHLVNIYNATCNAPIHQIISSYSIPDSFAESKWVKIANPDDHVTINDTRHITIRVSKTISDEEILARFVKGFFGGHVLAIERGLLKAKNKELTDLQALSTTPVSSKIWSKAQLSTHKLPPLHALIFGVWRLVESQVEAGPPSQPHLGPSSHVDFVFGWNDGFIAGIHRFSVIRADNEAKPDTNHDSTTNVTIEYAHTSCNPKENKPLKPDALMTLHMWYALLLFREGVGEVLKAQ